MTDVPVPDMKHCYRCGLDYPSELQHTISDCNSQLEKKWPPAGMETKDTPYGVYRSEMEEALRVMPPEDRKRLLDGDWEDKN